MHLTIIGKFLKVRDIDLLTANGALSNIWNIWHDGGLLDDAAAKSYVEEAPLATAALVETEAIAGTAVCLLEKMVQVPQGKSADGFLAG